MSVFKLVFKYKINIHCKNSERLEGACPSFQKRHRSHSEDSLSFCACGKAGLVFLTELGLYSWLSSRT